MLVEINACDKKLLKNGNILEFIQQNSHFELGSLTPVPLHLSLVMGKNTAW